MDTIMVPPFYVAGAEFLIEKSGKSCFTGGNILLIHSFIFAPTLLLGRSREEQLQKVSKRLTSFQQPFIVLQPVAVGIKSMWLRKKLHTTFCSVFIDWYLGRCLLAFAMRGGYTESC